MHSAYFQESVKMAEEHRFTHEFGAISSHIDSKPKVVFKDLVQKSSYIQEQNTLAKESNNQTNSMRNKFEESLAKVQGPKPPSTPKSQSHVTRSHLMAQTSPVHRAQTPSGTTASSNGTNNHDSPVPGTDDPEKPSKLTATNVQASTVQRLLEKEGPRYSLLIHLMAVTCISN